MSRTPVADWQQLSALYEAADALDPVSLDAWLAQLRAQTHPLLKQLEQMLAARAKVRRDDFLGALPALPVPPEAPEPKAEVWAEGSRIGPYRLVRHLGEGGMAEVWMAQRDDGAFQRTVAIKLLFRTAGSTQRDTFAQRFARERDILATLDHPNIAGLHDAGVTPSGQPWLALEYIEGETLIHWCDAQRLDIAARVRLFRQVLLAVQHAHANLVIHRDLKPGNILVTAKGEVRLLDFGIAKLMEAEGGTLAETELTRMAGRPMTPQYAAPEQLLGQPLTTACDVYALGVVLYQLLCGERPYELKLDSAAQLEQSIIDVEPRGPSRRTLTEAVVEARSTTPAVLHKTLASDLDAIVLRALAKQPPTRYASAEAFRADLDRWLDGEPVEARVPSAAYRASKFVRRHRLAVGLSVAAVLSLIGVTVVAVVMGLQAREDSARAGAARDFMLGLFKRADQEKARGADITARELLETGRNDLVTRLAGQPKLQVELLQGIGTIQRDMGEYLGADSSYAEAARVYGLLGMRREVAMALTEQANAAVRSGNLQSGRSALVRAVDVFGPAMGDSALNARMSEVEGWIAFAQRDFVRARDLFSQSRVHAQRIFGPFGTKTMDAMRGQMYAERQLRNFPEALRLLGLLEEAALKSSDANATDMPAIAKDRADLLFNAEHFAESLQVAISASSKCAADLGENHLMCRTLQLSKVNALLRLGWADRAADELPGLQVIANDRKSPALRANTLLTILKIDLATGDRARQVVNVQQVKDLVESSAGDTFGPTFKTRGLLALAEVRLRSADPLEAERLIEKAVSLHRRSDGEVPASLEMALAKSLRGIALIERGRGAEAVQSLSDCRSDLSKLLGQNSATTGLFSLNLALALERLNRPDEALAVVSQAEPALREALGANVPTYIRAKGIQDRLARAIRAASSSRGVSDPPETGGASREIHQSIDFFS
ncbi:MAG: serine/threonine-protein kinase [Burkholderiales bacterium]